MHATVVYGVLAMSQGMLCLANAGHPAPLLLRDGRALEVAPASGPPIGLAGDVSYGSVEIPLKPGDAFIAFTDGFTEAHGPGGELFGADRLSRCCERMDPHAPGFLDGLVRDVEAHAAPGKPHDDLTAILIARNP